MRQISFALTTRQLLDGSKSVTRRLGWANLKPGTLLQAIEKGQGIPKGGKVRKLGVIEVLSVRRERLDKMQDEYYLHKNYGHAECFLEGFPGMNPDEFVSMFCRHNDCLPETVITRVEFMKVYP